jgi:hypothetical protein
VHVQSIIILIIILADAFVKTLRSQVAKNQLITGVNLTVNVDASLRPTLTPLMFTLSQSGIVTLALITSLRTQILLAVKRIPQRFHTSSARLKKVASF